MNKVKTVFPFLLLILFVFFIGGCRENDLTTHYQVVPSDAAAVASIHAGAILQKSDISSLIDNMTTGMGASDEVMQKIKEIVKDGSASGLALDKPLLFFFRIEGEIGGFTAEISDRQKLNDLFALLEKQGFTSSVTKQDQYSLVTSLSKEFVFLFDRKKIIGLPYRGQETVDYAKQLMTQAEEKSILANREFMKSINSGDDISVFGSYASLPSLGITPPKIGIDITKLSLYSGLSFQNGLIRFSSEVFSSDPETEEFLQQQLRLSRKITRSHLSFFPATTMLLSVNNLDGPGYYSYMEPHIQTILSSLSVFFPGLEGLDVNEVTEVTKSLLNSINGEITLGVSAGSLLGIPSFLLYADVKNNAPVELLNKYLRTIMYVSRVEKVNGNNYRCDFMLPGVSLYYGEKNGTFYMTTDPAVPKSIGTSPAKSLNDAQLVKLIPKDSRGYAVADIESISRIPLLAVFLGQYTGQDPLAKSVLSQIKYLEFYWEEGNKGVAQLRLSNQEQNALKTIINMFNRQGIVN